VCQATAVGRDQRLDDLGVDPVADVRLALKGHHVREAGPIRDHQRRQIVADVLVADVLDEEHEQDIVLVLGRLHAAAQFVAAGPEG